MSEIIKRDLPQESAWFEREIPQHPSADYIAGLEFASEIVLDDQLHPSSSRYKGYPWHNGALRSASDAIERAVALAKSRANQQEQAMSEKLTEDDVYTLIGHAVILRGNGQEDMPKYFEGLAYRIAISLGDTELAKKASEVMDGKARQ